MEPSAMRHYCDLNDTREIQKAGFLGELVLKIIGEADSGKSVKGKIISSSESSSNGVYVTISYSFCGEIIEDKRYYDSIIESRKDNNAGITSLEKLLGKGYSLILSGGDEYIIERTN